MKICLDHISKRFQKHWIFRDINYSFTKPGNYSLLGQNGSGKSTLLRIIAGMQPPTVGKVTYIENEQAKQLNNIFTSISFTSPGQEIVEELTFREFLEFHFSFKPILDGMDISGIIEMAGIIDVVDKPIADYSSGMKQRVKLSQAIFSKTPVLLLDEPCTNLDQSGVDQYRNWMEQYAHDRLVIIASNDIREHSFCKEAILLGDYK